MDIFNEKQKDMTLLKEYCERSERKREDEKWLKDNRGKILPFYKGATDTVKELVEDFEFLYIPVDASGFDEEKVLNYLKDLIESGTEVIKTAIKTVESVDYDILEELCDQGVMSLDELKERAWVTKPGTPKLVTKRKKVTEEEGD